MNDEIIQWLTNELNHKNDAEREMNEALAMLYQLGVVEGKMVNGEPVLGLAEINKQDPFQDPITAAMIMYGYNLQAAEA